jgi:hypothetical protein
MTIATPLVLTLSLLFSQVMPMDKTLPEVVEASTTIVVARRGNRPGRTVQMPMEGVERKFARAQASWKVTEVLKGDPKLAGQEIWVDEFDWGFNLVMSREIAKGNHVLPSKEVPRYKSPSKTPPGPKDSAILFLRAEDDGAFQPSMMDAVESLKWLPQVKAACAPKPVK